MSVEQQPQDAAEALRDYAAVVDVVVRQYPDLEPQLRDLQHVVDDLAAVIEEEEGQTRPASSPSGSTHRRRTAMTRKPAARECDHPQYPAYKEEFGEDPARVLYHMDARPRIRAIDDSELLRAYLDVETDHDGPQREVIAACNRRLTELEALEATGHQAVVTDGGDRCVE